MLVLHSKLCEDSVPQSLLLLEEQLLVRLENPPPHVVVH